MGSAIAWDAVSLFDPVGLTDTINAFTGLDGGRGGFQGLMDHGMDLGSMFTPVNMDPFKSLY